VEQKINLQAGKHLLGFTFGHPTVKSNTKTLLIFFNHQLEFYFTPNYDANFSSLYQQIIVESAEGENSIKLTMSGLADKFGFIVSNISLRRIYNPVAENIIASPFNNSLVQFMNSLSGSRVLLSSLMSFFFNLDRFQFYIYHLRTSTYYSRLLLNLVKQFQNEKGLLYEALLYKFVSIKSAVTSFAIWLNSLDYKQARTDQYFLNLNSAGDGFMGNI